MQQSATLMNQVDPELTRSSKRLKSEDADFRQPPSPLSNTVALGLHRETSSTSSFSSVQEAVVASAAPSNDCKFSNPKAKRKRKSGPLCSMPLEIGEDGMIHFCETTQEDDRKFPGDAQQILKGLIDGGFMRQRLPNGPTAGLCGNCRKKVHQFMKPKSEIFHSSVYSRLCDDGNNVPAAAAAASHNSTSTRSLELSTSSLSSSSESNASSEIHPSGVLVQVSNPVRVPPRQLIQMVQLNLTAVNAVLVYQINLCSEPTDSLLWLQKSLEAILAAIPIHLRAAGQKKDESLDEDDSNDVICVRCGVHCVSEVESDCDQSQDFNDEIADVSPMKDIDVPSAIVRSSIESSSAQTSLLPSKPPNQQHATFPSIDHPSDRLGNKGSTPSDQSSEMRDVCDSFRSVRKVTSQGHAANHAAACSPDRIFKDFPMTESFNQPLPFSDAALSSSNDSVKHSKRRREDGLTNHFEAKCEALLDEGKETGGRAIRFENDDDSVPHGSHSEFPQYSRDFPLTGANPVGVSIKDRVSLFDHFPISEKKACPPAAASEALKSPHLPSELDQADAFPGGCPCSECDRRKWELRASVPVDNHIKHHELAICHLMMPGNLNCRGLVVRAAVQFYNQHQLDLKPKVIITEGRIYLNLERIREFLSGTREATIHIVVNVDGRSHSVAFRNRPQSNFLSVSSTFAKSNPSLESYPTLNIMIAGVTGVGKSALIRNLSTQDEGGVDSYLAASTQVQTFPTRSSLIPDPRERMPPGSKIAANLIDLVGLCDPDSARSIDASAEHSLSLSWQHLQDLNCVLLLVKNDRDFQEYQDRILQLIKAFKTRGFTNAHFLVVLTHIDTNSSEEVILKRQLLDTSFAKELRIASIDAIVSGVTQDFREILSDNTFSLAKATCRNILQRVLREDAPAPCRFKDPASVFSQSLSSHPFDGADVLNQDDLGSSPHAVSSDFHWPESLSNPLNNSEMEVWKPSSPTVLEEFPFASPFAISWERSRPAADIRDSQISPKMRKKTMEISSPSSASASESEASSFNVKPQATAIPARARLCCMPREIESSKVVSFCSNRAERRVTSSALRALNPLIAQKLLRQNDCEPALCRRCRIALTETPFHESVSMLLAPNLKSQIFRTAGSYHTQESEFESTSTGGTIDSIKQRTAAEKSFQDGDDSHTMLVTTQHKPGNSYQSANS